MPTRCTKQSLRKGLVCVNLGEACVDLGGPYFNKFLLVSVGIEYWSSGGSCHMTAKALVSEILLR
jgi:hypothetical protein